MIRGAIFDVDGTLLDSMPVWRDAGNRFLERLGIVPEAGLAATLYPMSFEEGAAYLKRRYRLPQSQAEIQAGISGVIGDFYRREVRLKRGAEEFLRRLDRAGIAMVLATTGAPALIAAALERLGVARYFQKTFTCTQFDTTKRQPLIYRRAAQFLGCGAEETLVFEDVLYALQAAGDAGFRTVAVADDESRRDWEKMRATARYFLEDYTDWDGFWRFLTTS